MISKYIFSIDPGNTVSAYVLYDTAKKIPIVHGIVPNHELRQILSSISENHPDVTANNIRLAIEMIASYGMAVGASVFETTLWIGRFIERWNMTYPKSTYRLVYRKEEKMHLCGTMKAKDGNIRQALMDRYGSTRQVALGTKKQPGPLFGVAADVWAALAIAIVAAETEGDHPWSNN